MSKRSKITVLLDESEFVRFDAYCTERGHKKSTLIARLVRDYLNHEEFRQQQELRFEANRNKVQQ